MKRERKEKRKREKIRTVFLVFAGQHTCPLSALPARTRTHDAHVACVHTPASRNDSKNNDKEKKQRKKTKHTQRRE